VSEKVSCVAGARWRRPRFGTGGKEKATVEMGIGFLGTRERKDWERKGKERDRRRECWEREAKEGKGGTWRKEGRKEMGERLSRRETGKGRVGMLEKRETVERKGKVEARERWERCRGKDGRKGRKG